MLSGEEIEHWDKEKTCSTCGFFIPASVCREEIKTELENCNAEGLCGERTQAFIFTPYISRAAFAHCGKWAAPVMNWSQSHGAHLPEADCPSGSEG